MWNTISTQLAGFNDRPLFSAHDDMNCRLPFSWVRDLCPVIGELRAISSAYLMSWELGVCRASVWPTNRNGDKIASWGTPNSLGRADD